jgi:hypothetical protein
MHVYRWDLDKTYLETEIDSVRGLVRAAFEQAHEKRTVPGAAALIKGLRDHDPEARVVVISGSPLQMREVLEQKLALDGVRVDRLILKDNLRNLRKGRLRALRGQIGYKLPHLLEDRAVTDARAGETLFGDDSETDALIYAAYREIVAGRLDRDGLLQLLSLGGAYPDAMEAALAAMARVTVADAVDAIFIRIEPIRPGTARAGVPIATYRLLGPSVMPVFSWLQAALALHERGRLSADGVAAVAAAAGPIEAVAGWTTDAVRRGLVRPGTIESLLELSWFVAIRERVGTDLRRLGPPAELSQSGSGPDLFGFYRATHAPARAPAWR